jgi:hypothetical protein
MPQPYELPASERRHRPPFTSRRASRLSHPLPWIARKASTPPAGAFVIWPATDRTIPMATSQSSRSDAARAVPRDRFPQERASGSLVRRDRFRRETRAVALAGRILRQQRSDHRWERAEGVFGRLRESWDIVVVSAQGRARNRSGQDGRWRTEAGVASGATVPWGVIASDRLASGSATRSCDGAAIR